MHKLLVYKDYLRSSGVIRLCECAAPQQRDTRSAEIIGGHDDIEGGEPLVRGQILLTFDLQSHSAGSGCRQIGGNCDGLRARNVLETRDHVPDKQGLLRGIFVSRTVQGHAGSKEMICLEPQILVLNKKDSADQQPGPDQEKQRQRYLAGDHHGPETAMRTARGCRATFFLQVRVDISSRCT